MKIEDLVKAAKENNMQELALTDNCNLFGAMEFSQTAVNNGLPTESISNIKKNASQVYYTQNRMVSAQDYNVFPYSKSSNIQKLKAVIV